MIMTKTNDDDNYNVDKDTMIDEEHCEIVMIMGYFLSNYVSFSHTLASFRFEDDDENEDQVQLLLIVRMLKSVAMMA